MVPAGGGGTFLGGYIVKKWNMRCRGIVRLCVMCTAISLVTILVFLVHCPNMPMAGITAPYRSGLTEQQWQSRRQRLYEDATRPPSGNRLAGRRPAAGDGETRLLSSSSPPQFRPGGEPGGGLQRSVWLCA